jgi:hypothetical protein
LSQSHAPSDFADWRLIVDGLVERPAQLPLIRTVLMGMAIGCPTLQFCKWLYYTIMAKAVGALHPNTSRFVRTGGLGTGTGLPIGIIGVPGANIDELAVAGG